jgi:hypothetical protein
MSLIKQLWIGIIVLLLLILSGNFVISTITAKTYLQEQLRLKNIDNANSLALSISQMPDKDPITLELLITRSRCRFHKCRIKIQSRWSC